MYKYNRLIKKEKQKQSVAIAFGDILLFIFPTLCVFDRCDDIFNFKCGRCLFLLASGITYCAYLVYRLLTVYKISNDKRDVYRKQCMEQLDSVILNKYKLLCNEVHYANHQDKDILLYNAHDVIRDILAHIKQLISNITGVPLDDTSVNFVYKYFGDNEHWQTIDGSSSCSIGCLDDIVEKGESVYHHLYANNREYLFFNKKADADWHIYRPSIRDGDDRSTWGSIYCKRILCTMHQDRFVDGILAISTYNEKFTVAKRKAAVAEVEELINEAVSTFTNLIKIEMASLYIRHEHIKNSQIEAINLLIESGQVGSYDKNGEKLHPEIMTEEERVAMLHEELPKFKNAYNEKMPGSFDLDDRLDRKTEIALKDYVTRNKHTDQIPPQK